MTSALAHHEQHHLVARAESYRSNDSQFARWAAGFCVIRHRDDTQVRVFDMAVELEQRGRAEDSGMVAPIMIANGRRIEQRSTLEQQGVSRRCLEPAGHALRQPLHLAAHPERDGGTHGAAPGWWLNPLELAAMTGAGDVPSIVTSDPREI